MNREGKNSDNVTSLNIGQKRENLKISLRRIEEDHLNVIKDNVKDIEVKVKIGKNLEQISEDLNFV